MNDLQKLIKLRGMTIREVAELIGHGYHMTQKVIKGTRYKRSDGSFGVYTSTAIEEAVAGLLGLTPGQVWGDGAKVILRKLIQQEIKTTARQRESELRAQYLNNSSIPEKQAGGNV